MAKPSATRTEKDAETSWRQVVSHYNFPDLKSSIWQLTNSLLPFFGLWVLMYYSLNWSYWITLALSIPLAGFMVRIFIIFHDCGHRSFFKSAKWNEGLGFFLASSLLLPIISGTAAIISIMLRWEISIKGG